MLVTCNFDSCCHCNQWTPQQRRCNCSAQSKFTVTDIDATLNLILIGLFKGKVDELNVEIEKVCNN